ncbi:glutamate--cysteine ligase [Advenella kashmirensis WT001]|uniref:Glutamate--cysteine ligase n=1 Tax=Advenella kashmirensis (strain DSM 17095 / LMG 22695 / WT001) TaxID=1036672 RepID=I3U9C6_ADVKW|nr:glutamate--cysteine ligase [Advenella kashmirensis WT001]
MLQIENEYYSTIRPKRTTARGERPITALMERGIQYVEIRCLDIDPFSAVGISNATCHFMDAFLLFCAVHDSRLFPYDGFCEESQANFTDVVNRGRDPALRLTSNGEDISIPVWGNQLLDQIALYAKELDIAFSTTQYSAAIQEQRHKLDDVSATPSARILQELRDSGLSFADYTQLQSQRLTDELRFGELSADTEQKMRASVKKSLEDQAEIEASDNESFDEYVERYMAALKRPE